VSTILIWNGVVTGKSFLQKLHTQVEIKAFCHIHIKIVQFEFGGFNLGRIPFFSVKLTLVTCKRKREKVQNFWPPLHYLKKILLTTFLNGLVVRRRKAASGSLYPSIIWAAASGGRPMLRPAFIGSRLARVCQRGSQGGMDPMRTLFLHSTSLPTSLSANPDGLQGRPPASGPQCATAGRHPSATLADSLKGDMSQYIYIKLNPLYHVCLISLLHSCLHTLFLLLNT